MISGTNLAEITHSKTKEAELLAVQEQLKLTDYEKLRAGWIIAWNV